MSNYSKVELEDAKGAIESSIRKIEKAQATLSKKDPPPKAQLTLAKRNLNALQLALNLIYREIEKSAD